ncbi:ferritin-like domain-containing protein [Granulicella sp. L46]|uniref:ferritin-like domain-containing protein n=1 Tax=Granulicella sp. L46 TaxID=1641865 RepID=UPI00131CDC39|nr:ferritin-like domain-containing protein [Granulicella sp. L46]
MKTLDSLVEKALSRRTFLAGAGAVAATAVAGCSNNGSMTGGGGGGGNTYTDADVLNFALNLEYLEAQFYLYAATGSGLATADTMAPSSYTGKYTEGTVTVGEAAQVPGLTSAQQDILNEIAFEEQTHVQFLRSALGSAAVPMPDIDLSFFGPLAVAATITTAATGDGSFNPFSSFDYFLVGAFIFEDVGVTAYAGAAPLITPAGVTAGLLTAAAGILAVEAYHAGYVRTSLTGRAIAAGSASAYPYLAAANKVEALRATLTVGNSAAPSTEGSVETLLVLPTSTSTPSAIVAADPTHAVGFSRTVNQVHHIVYGSPTVGVAKGGFFPNGTNSIFATTTA